MATSKSTETVSLAQRRQAVAEAYLGGEPMQAIAQRLGINVGTVHHDLKVAGVSSRSRRKSDIQPGVTFGQLTALEPRGEDWLCRCACGQEELANATALRKGRHVRCHACRNPTTPSPEKACRKCKRVLPNTTEFFTANQQHRFGLRAAYKECLRPKVNADGLVLRRRLRLEVLTHYSNGEPRCACCGEATFEFLALDHLEGSSRADYKRHGNKFFAWLKRNGYPLKAQVLCHNCNAAKAIHGYCCVHQDRPDGDLLPKKTKPAIILPPTTPDELAKSGGVEKECYACHRLFPASDVYFHRHKRMSTGLLNICKECDRIAHLKHSQDRNHLAKLQVFAHYCSSEVPQCESCKITAFEFLTIDHIHGGGAKHRREEKINNLAIWLVKQNFPEGFRILCFNCNLSSGFYSPPTPI